MLILLGHLQVAYHCINVILIFRCFDKSNSSYLNTYMIMTHVLLKPIQSRILYLNFVFFNVYHIDCFCVNMFTIVILDHLKPYACH